RRDDQIAIIAEIKKASPSSGLIAEPFDPIAIAENYERSGAEAISVLTDQTFFQGSLTDLIDVRRHVSLPILRKDFIVDEIQIAESVLAGASAVLLIVAALEGKELLTLSEAAVRYHLVCRLLLEKKKITNSPTIVRAASIVPSGIRAILHVSRYQSSL